MKRLGRILALLERALARPWAPAAILVLTAALFSTTLTAGVHTDDHVRHSVQQGVGVAPGSSPFDLFTFLSGRVEDAERLKAAGVLPWWTDTEARLRFFRPLAAASHAIDHAVAPGNAVLEHVHSLVWYLLSVAALWLLLRGFSLPRWLAAFAMLVYAVDDGHAGAMSWVASRNGLMAATFAFLTLWAHDRWRRRGWSGGALLGPSFFLLAMASGEAGAGAFGYLIAHAIFLDRGRRRFLALAPYLVVLAGFASIYAIGGFGARHTSLYIDPVHEPLRFLAAVVTQVPIFVQAMLGGLSADLWIAYGLVNPALPIVVWIFAALGVAVFLWLSRPIWQEDAEARFWLVGALLACVPICAGVSADRLLLITGAGVFVVVVQVIVRLVQLGGPGRLARAAAIGLFVTNLPIAMLLAPQRGRTTGVIHAFDRADASLVDGPVGAQDTVIVVNPPVEPMVGYATFARLSRGEAAPAAWRVLAGGTRTLEVERVDQRTLRIRGTDGLLARLGEMLTRSADRDLPVGARVELPGMTVEIEAVTDDGRPATALYRFAAPLEDSHYRWRQWQGRGFVAFTPPAIGQKVALAPVDLLKVFGD